MACAGHVLSEGFRVARDVLANVGGNRARPQIIERACRGSDENLNRLSFVKGFFLRGRRRNSQKAQDENKANRKNMLVHKASRSILIDRSQIISLSSRGLNSRYLARRVRAVKQNFTCIVRVKPLRGLSPGNRLRWRSIQPYFVEIT